MKWPKRYPVMRSAKQAFYVRELCINYMMNNIDCSYEDMQQYIKAIETYTKFILKRSVDIDVFKDIHYQYSRFRNDFRWSKKDSIRAIAIKQKLSERAVKYLLKQSL